MHSDWASMERGRGDAGRAWGGCALLVSLSAIVCEKLGVLEATRWAIGAFTVLALALIGGFGVRAYRRHRYGGANGPHDFDSPEDRHRFLGFAALLLAGLSAVAVVFQALPALTFGSCR